MGAGLLSDLIEKLKELPNGFADATAGQKDGQAVKRYAVVILSHVVV